MTLLGALGWLFVVVVVGAASGAFLLWLIRRYAP